MRLIRYDEDEKESRAQRDLTFTQGNSNIIEECEARKLQSNLIIELIRKKKRTLSSNFLLKNVLYISLIYLLHTYCMCVAYPSDSNTSEQVPQLL